MVSLTVIAVKLNSTASIILFRKDYLSQQWSFQVKEMHPQVSVSFIKCDRNSIGTSEKVDPIWRKDAWNGGMVEYPKTQNGGKRLHREVSIVAVKVDNTEKKTL